MIRRPWLWRLSRQLGIVPNYRDALGIRRDASDSTRELLISALGFDASTERAARASLQVLLHRQRAQPVDPVRVVLAGLSTESAPAFEVRCRCSPEKLVAARLVLEDGAIQRLNFKKKTGKARTGTIRIPRGLPLGYHSLEITLCNEGNDSESLHGQRIIVAPRKCWTIREALGNQPSFGLWTNLYSLRGQSQWSIGGLRELDRLCSWAANSGADFVGINPLHALHNRGDEISPYSPISRLFRNPIYLDIESIPEWNHPRRNGQAGLSKKQEALLRRIDAAASIDYEQTSTIKLDILRRLFSKFEKEHLRTRSVRGQEFRKFVEGGGSELLNFSTYCAIVDDFIATGNHTHRGKAPHKSFDPLNWRTWSRPMQNIHSPEVWIFQESHRREIRFHCYLQFELDRQIGGIHRAARQAGMRLGLYHDLAIGTSRGGFDTWSNPDLFLNAVSIGCPPDLYAPQGQNWNFPPINPITMREQGFVHWRNLLRATIAHAGMIRIDHVMGLFRQFWIPEGRSGTDGAYVRFPADELLAVLALESRRHHTVVVGEDLGTVPRNVPLAMRRWGILSTRVLYFERDKRGTFRAASSYPTNAVAMARTHDHVPLAGFLSKRDVKLLRSIGECKTAEYDQVLRQRDRDIQALMRRLVTEGLLAVRATPTPAEYVRAIYRFLAGTSSAMLAVALDDLVGEEFPVNIPGISMKHYRAWTRRMTRTIEDIAADPTIREVLRSIAAAR